MKSVWISVMLGWVVGTMAQAEETLRTISVTGHGMVEAEPDQAGLIFSIQKEAPTATEAKEEVDVLTGELLDLFDEMGVPSNRVNTSAISIAPMYNHHQGKRTFRGFNVSRQVTLTLKQLTKLEVLMERAVQGGVTHVSPPVLTHSREQELQTKAYEKACAHARINAYHLARQFDARLGSVRRVQQIPGPGFEEPFGQPRRAMAFEAGSGHRDTMRLGQIEIEVTVHAVFDLRVE